MNLIKYFGIQFILFGLIGFLGCQQNSESNNPRKPYDAEEAIENGDVVDSHGEISNLD